jgi:hypothetical protein
LQDKNKEKAMHVKDKNLERDMKKDRKKMTYRHVQGFGRKTRMKMIETGQDQGMEMTETKRNQACRGHRQRERQSEKHVEGRTKRKVSN